jgi:hypothetical protein
LFRHKPLHPHPHLPLSSQLLSSQLLLPLSRILLVAFVRWARQPASSLSARRQVFSLLVALPAKCSMRPQPLLLLLLLLPLP